MAQAGAIGLAPSEVRAMTQCDLMAWVAGHIRAKGGAREGLGPDDRAALRQRMAEVDARNRKAQHG